MQEKYERSLLTPKGLKTFRLQPSIDNTSLLKVSCCLILLYLQSRNLKVNLIAASIYATASYVSSVVQYSSCISLKISNPVATDLYC